MSVVSIKKSGKYVSCHVRPVVDTSIYASGDLLFLLEELENILPYKGAILKIKDMLLIDKADQGSAMSILVMNNTFTEADAANDALAETDANIAAYLEGIIPVASGDWKDLGGQKVANIKNIDMLVKGGDINSLYLLGLCEGTPTFAAATDLDIIIKGELSLDQ